MTPQTTTSNRRQNKTKTKNAKHEKNQSILETDLRRFRTCHLRGLFPRFIHLWAHRGHVHGHVRRDVYVNADLDRFFPSRPSYSLSASTYPISFFPPFQIPQAIPLIDFICYAYPGKEYAAADTRWGTADPTIVSLELLTVFGTAPLAAYIAYQIVRGDSARYYWIIVLCTAELYGGYVFRRSLPPPRDQDRHQLICM